MSCLSTHASSRGGCGWRRKESGSPVGGADIGCSYNAPLTIEPDRGKVGEHPVESQSKVHCDVLTDNEAGSQYANGVEDRRPEVARVTSTTLPSRLRERLAGVATDEDVDRFHRAEPPHVGQDRHAGPVALEHRTRGRVGLAQPRGLHVEHPLERQVQTPDARAHRAVAHSGPQARVGVGRGEREGALSAP